MYYVLGNVGEVYFFSCGGCLVGVVCLGLLG